MKKMWKVLVVSMVIAGILAAVLAVTISASGPRNNSSGSTSWQGGGSVLDDVSKIIGLTPEQIQEQRQAGKSLVQIAATRDVTQEALIKAIMAEKQQAVQALVTAGTITQVQADQRVAFMQARVQSAVNRTTVGPPDWAGASGNGQNSTGNRNSMMRQGGLRGNQEKCTGTPGTCTGAGSMLRSGRGSR
jgi:hypothetical protein